MRVKWHFWEESSTFACHKHSDPTGSTLQDKETNPKEKKKKKLTDSVKKLSSTTVLQEDVLCRPLTPVPKETYDVGVWEYLAYANLLLHILYTILGLCHVHNFDRHSFFCLLVDKQSHPTINWSRLIHFKTLTDQDGTNKKYTGHLLSVRPLSKGLYHIPVFNKRHRHDLICGHKSGHHWELVKANQLSLTLYSNKRFLEKRSTKAKKTRTLTQNILVLSK